jgi:predicted nucleic acid-binding Zn ribbon protein
MKTDEKTRRRQIMLVILAVLALCAVILLVVFVWPRVTIISDISGGR